MDTVIRTEAGRQPIDRTVKYIRTDRWTEEETREWTDEQSDLSERYENREMMNRPTCVRNVFCSGNSEHNGFSVQTRMGHRQTDALR